ncbi:8-oxo-dGTP diphosphatase [Patescibacteria group bacterium]|nr:8-oxo-dGTP diphosphatase [Patescibacteria group bacterium]
MTIQQYKQSLILSLKQRTLCLLIKNGKILLAKKKRGFGEGKWLAGAGGKVEELETLENAIIRETIEEINVTPNNFVRIATLNFYFPYADKPEKWNQQVCVFVSNDWSGEIKESDEILPQWFNFSEIPFDLMWSDAYYWLPDVIKGNVLDADFLFKSNLEVEEYKIKNNFK